MALAATLVGFGFLVVALVTGTLWLAVACIAVCALGGAFLLADIVGLRDLRALRRSRRTGAPPPDDAAEPMAESDPADVLDDTDTDTDTAESTGADRDHEPAGTWDTEATTEFPRLRDSEPVVTLDSSGVGWQSDIADSAAAGLAEDPVTTPPTRHGRHEVRSHGSHASEADEPDVAPRRGRHGAPD